MQYQLSRIEQFRQLKNDISVGDKTWLIIGIDVSKSKSVACIVDSNNICYVKKLVFNNNLEGINFLMNKAKQLQKEYKFENTIYGLEPTANYHKAIASYLISKQVNLVGISTVGASQNRKSLDGRWRKNDTKDAYNITDMIRQTKFFYYKENLEYESLRSLLKTRQKLMISLASNKIRLRNNHFALYFPEIDSLYYDILHPEIVKILKHFPTAYDIRKLHFSFFAKILKSKHPTSSKKERIHIIWNLAKNSIGQIPLASTYLKVKFILEQIELLQKQIIDINIQIQKTASSFKEYNLLLTIPGFGPLLSAIFIAYVGNINDYEHFGQLTKLAGLDLEYEQSGKYHSKAIISKKGNSLLRYAVCKAVITALLNKKINAYFKEKLKTKGDSKETRAKFRIKLAEKMLRSAYTMLKTKNPFDLELFLNPVKLNPINERRG